MRCTVYGANEFQRGISQIPPFKKRAAPRFRFDLRYEVDRGTIQGVGYLDYLGVSTPPGSTDPLYLSTSLFRSWRWRPGSCFFLPRQKADVTNLSDSIFPPFSIVTFIQFVPSIIDLKLERLEHPYVHGTLKSQFVEITHSADGQPLNFLGIAYVIGKIKFHGPKWLSEISSIT